MALDTPVSVDTYMLWPEIGHPVLERPQTGKPAEEENFGRQSLSVVPFSKG